MMLWLLDHPDVEQSLLSPAEVDQLVNHDFEGYYSEYAASHFAAQVWVNNAWVAALCLALGVLGLPVILLLFRNIANLAVIGSIMTRHGHGGHFWGLILPHGMLELTAVFVAAGVGLRLFWSWGWSRGSCHRAQSLAREGQGLGPGQRAGSSPTTRTAAAPPRPRRRPRSARAGRAGGAAPRSARRGRGAVMIEPMIARFEMLLEQQVDHRQPEDAQRQAERGHPGVVDPDLGAKCEAAYSL